MVYTWGDFSDYGLDFVSLGVDAGPLCLRKASASLAR